MKRILFISAFPPNRKTAGQNYTRQLLNDLSSNYEIDLICFDFKDHDIEVDNSINRLMFIPKGRINIFSIIFAPLFFPLFIRRFKPNILKKIRNIAHLYDYVYFDFSQVFIYSLFISHPAKILMSHDIIYQKFGRKKIFLRNLFMPIIKRTEKLLLKTGSNIFCFSTKDKDLIREFYHLPSIPVSFYIDPIIININLEDISIDNYFVFYGAWNRTENSFGLKWFLEEVYDKINTPPRIKIIGGGLSEDLIELVNKHEYVEYVGFVDDPYSIICESQALIAPVFDGAGVKVKVIEALATGTPIIGTNVAFEGIVPLESTKINMMIHAETVNDFVNAISNYRLVTNKEKEISKSIFLNSYSSHKFSDIITNL